MDIILICGLTAAIPTQIPRREPCFVFERKREQVPSRPLKAPILFFFEGSHRKIRFGGPFTPGRPNYPGPIRHTLPHRPATHAACGAVGGSPGAGAQRGEARPGSRAPTPYDSTLMLGNASRQGIYLDRLCWRPRERMSSSDLGHGPRHVGIWKLTTTRVTSHGRIVEGTGRHHVQCHR